MYCAMYAARSFGNPSFMRMFGMSFSNASGDGYFCELKHFVECIAAGKPSPIVPPQSAYQSVKLIEAEVKSALTGKTVPVKL